jgi:hypothetical protein
MVAASGLVAFCDPVRTRPSWTAAIFEHDGFSESHGRLVRKLLARQVEKRIFAGARSARKLEAD